VNNNIFSEESAVPDEAAVRTALGKGYARYEALLVAAEGFTPEWKYHGKKYGWKLKIHDGDKALAELSIVGSKGEADGSGALILLGVAARGLEVEELRDDPGLEPELTAFLSGSGAKEGWGLRIEVRDEASGKLARGLIERLAELRRGLAGSDEG
jgi:hypothetical protein